MFLDQYDFWRNTIKCKFVKTQLKKTQRCSKKINKLMTIAFLTDFIKVTYAKWAWSTFSNSFGQFFPSVTFARMKFPINSTAQQTHTDTHTQEHHMKFLNEFLCLWLAQMRHAKGTCTALVRRTRAMAPPFTADGASVSSGMTAKLPVCGVTPYCL